MEELKDESKQTCKFVKYEVEGNIVTIRFEQIQKLDLKEAREFMSDLENITVNMDSFGLVTVVNDNLFNATFTARKYIARHDLVKSKIIANGIAVRKTLMKALANTFIKMTDPLNRKKFKVFSDETSAKSWVITKLKNEGP